jgi:hypothetical protein
VADDAPGQKKFFKVKYIIGALSYGAKIQSGTYIKHYLDIYTLHFLGAFSWVQGAFSCFAILLELISKKTRHKVLNM